MTAPHLLRIRKLTLSIGGVAAVVAFMSGCAGTKVFEGQTAFSVMGTPPAPPAAPPPPPPKKDEPPPRVEVRENKIEIHEKIQFEYNKATIKPESFSLLDEITDVIKKNPHIKKIQIEGHASSEGNAAYNKALSDRRAKSVMKYLVDHGIEAARLTAKGFGSEKPIATNDTEEGREQNRRVEFNILEQDVTQKKVQVDPNTGKEKVLSTTSKAVSDDMKPKAGQPGKLSNPKAGNK